MKSIIGRKMGMTEVFAADGSMVPSRSSKYFPTSSSTRKPWTRMATKP